jgi:hypothetical protein
MHDEPRPEPPPPSPAPARSPVSPRSPAPPMPPAPAGTAARDEAAVERRLRRLGSRCAVPAAAALVAAGTIGWMAGRGGAPDWMASPPADSFLIALAGLLLVLLSSGVYGRILRRDAAPELEPDDGAAEERRRPPLAWAEERLSAYSRATGIAFAMLTVAAGVGALVAIAGKAPLYGLVICLASLLSMAARWPRRSGFDLALEAEAPPPPAGPGTG